MDNSTRPCINVCKTHRDIVNGRGAVPFRLDIGDTWCRHNVSSVSLLLLGDDDRLSMDIREDVPCTRHGLFVLGCPLIVHQTVSCAGFGLDC